jgi:DNA-binding transcriptional ArsR family regulator
MNLDRTFHALSDSTRRAILSRLTHGEATVGELAEPFDITLSAVSKHLHVLERANLVERIRHGRTTRCSVVPGALEGAQAWITRHRAFWDDRLDALETIVASPSDDGSGEP